jgi:hypothetical protein
VPRVLLRPLSSRLVTDRDHSRRQYGSPARRLYHVRTAFKIPESLDGALVSLLCANSSWRSAPFRSALPTARVRVENVASCTCRMKTLCDNWMFIVWQALVKHMFA